MGDECKDRQNLNVSYALGIVSIFVAFCGCLCCCGWSVFFWFDILRCESNEDQINCLTLVAQAVQKYLEPKDFEPKEEAAVQPGQKEESDTIPRSRSLVWRVLAFGIFFILMPLAIFTGYVLTLFKDLVNAWLLINSTNIFLQLLGVPAVPVWFTKLTESLRSFLQKLHLAFLADWWAWLSAFFELIETLGSRLFQGMQVTCEGSQMPLFVCLNFSLIFFAVILIESNFDLLLGITVSSTGENAPSLSWPFGSDCAAIWIVHGITTAIAPNVHIFSR